MIADISITDKSFGNKLLYDHLHLSIQAKEKIGLIGRNGVGKSTLLGLMDKSDTDFLGNITYRKGTVVIATRQEHHAYKNVTTLNYILGDLPEYASLKHTIDSFSEADTNNIQKLTKYSEAIERFTSLGYYQIEDVIVRELENYQIDQELAHSAFHNLSGGQKRLAEIVKVMHAHADLALIDEPTNHMDYKAKAQFIEWMQTSAAAMLIVTHDRDVLEHVDRIIEIKDGKALSYSGNYDHYLRQNLLTTTTQLHDFEVTQRRISNLKEKIIYFRRLKEKARDPGTVRQFKIREQQAEEELEELVQKDKPTFWIDRESIENLDYRIEASYHKHKTKNIRLLGIDHSNNAPSSAHLLIEARKLSLGYNGKALFRDVNFELREHERIEFRGRNGAGKTTLIRAILLAASRVRPPTILGGSLATENNLRIGIYEQEISSQYFNLPLGQAIERLYLDRQLSISREKVMQLLSSYLFNPYEDIGLSLRELSGGQKARFQLMAMLANSPQLLILDEPTNHLDLPSIEELEQSLQHYHGAIIYVSHDNYFRRKIDASVIPIGEQ